MASTKYGQVSRMAAKLEPYCGLWTLAARFYDKYAGWMSGPFSKLRPEEVETEVSDACRKVYKLSKVRICCDCTDIYTGSRENPELPFLALSGKVVNALQATLQLSSVC